LTRRNRSRSITKRAVKHPNSRQIEAAAASIRRRLGDFTFEGDVWADTLEELRYVLGTDATLAYLPVRNLSNWTFEFGRVSLAKPELTNVYDLFVKFVNSQDG